MKKSMLMGALMLLVSFFATSAFAQTTTQDLYVYQGGAVAFKTAAANVDSVALENGKTIISLYATDGTKLYSAAYSEVDSMVYVTKPKADLLDVVFNADGTATDISPASRACIVNSGPNMSVYYNAAYQRYVARFKNTWGGSAQGCYKFDYENDEDYKDKLAAGHSMEMVVMADPTFDDNGLIADLEAKPFASHQAGGTGFLVCKRGSSSGRGQNEWTFLPNVSENGASSWRWGTSGVQPEPGVYYHIIGVFDKSKAEARIYINGELKGTVSTPGNLNFASTGAQWFGIGADSDAGAGSNGWRGDVVLARVYSTALNDADVALLWDDLADIDPTITTDFISNYTLPSSITIEAGQTLVLPGEGFAEGDKLAFYEIENNEEVLALPITVVEEGAAFTVPAGVATGTYRVFAVRGTARQDLGLTLIKVNDASTRPVADMLDIVFNEDGTATDVSPWGHEVKTISGYALTTYYNEAYQRYVARFENPWKGGASAYYRVDYGDDQDFMNLLASGHTLEAVFMANDPDALGECKPFSSMQAGGTGFLVTAPSRDNVITFLPNVSTSGSSTWRWATSTEHPEQGTYYHVVGVWNKDKGTAEIYINGELRNSIDAPGELVHASSACRWFAIGGDPASASSADAAWRGDIVLARIYSTPLNEEQVGELWKEIQPYQEAVKPGLVKYVNLASGYQVEKGTVIGLDGDGFEEGDALDLYKIETGEHYKTIPAVLSGTGIDITITERLVTGTYRVYLKRGDIQEYLGYTTISYIDRTEAPTADMLDIEFSYDGTAIDKSPMGLPITKIGTTSTTYYSSTYKRYVARFDNPWSGNATGFYKADYSNNETFKGLLVGGLTMETVIMADYDELPDAECKPFSSMEAGGLGFLVTRKANGKFGGNDITFLPHVGGSYRWATSGITPDKKVYLHVVGVYNPETETAQTYVNGELVGETVAPGTLKLASASCNWFAIGADPNGTSTANAAWRGDVVLARIYGRALDEDQVYKLWEVIDELQQNALPDMVTDITFDKDYPVIAGADFEIKGEGFAAGDKVIIRDPSQENQIIATLDVTLIDGGVKIVLPNNIENKSYTLAVVREENEQYLGSKTFTVVETMPAGAEVIAHRGYWTKLENKTQNSLESLNAALDLNIYGSETDIWITTDDALMVNHDATLGGVRLETSTYDDCIAVNLSNGEPMPSLADFLFAKGDSESPTKLIVEIKTHSSAARGLAAAEATVNLINEAEMADCVEYIAFSFDICKKLAELAPNAKIAYLNGDKSPEELHAVGITGIDYTLAQLRKHPEWIQEAHDLGMTVNVWTIDTKADMIECTMMGADYITTNYPEMAAEVKAYFDNAAK